MWSFIRIYELDIHYWWNNGVHGRMYILKPFAQRLVNIFHQLCRKYKMLSIMVILDLGRVPHPLGHYIWGFTVSSSHLAEAPYKYQLLQFVACVYGGRQAGYPGLFRPTSNPYIICSLQFIVVLLTLESYLKTPIQITQKPLDMKLTNL